MPPPGQRAPCERSRRPTLWDASRVAYTHAEHYENFKAPRAPQGWGAAGPCLSVPPGLQLPPGRLPEEQHPPRGVEAAAPGQRGVRTRRAPWEVGGEGLAARSRPPLPPPLCLLSCACSASSSGVLRFCPVLLPLYPSKQALDELTSALAEAQATAIGEGSTASATAKAKAPVEPCLLDWSPDQPDFCPDSCQQLAALVSGRDAPHSTCRQGSAGEAAATGVLDPEGTLADCCRETPSTPLVAPQGVPGTLALQGCLAKSPTSLQPLQPPCAVGQ